MNRLQRLRRNESGMSYVFVGFGFMAMMAASMLAIDVGMMMTARSQAQNSADAGALAGVTALAFDDWDDRSPTGPAVTNAIAAGKANAVARGEVTVEPADVEFPLDPVTGEANRVRVTVHRSGENAFDTLIAGAFGFKKVGVNAIATAEASPANAMTCVKPFTIPDRWREMQDPDWDPTDTFDRYDIHGRLISNPDVYIPAYDTNGNPDPNYTGYNTEAMRGTLLVLRAGQGNNIMPSMYYSLAMTNDTGADDYEWNIAHCNHTIYRWGDALVQEPGDKQGPTISGIEALIAQDPDAVWNTSTNQMEGSKFGTGQQSPRVFPIPLFDPDYYDGGQQEGRVASLRTANWIGYFVEYIGGSQIYGRIIPIAGIRDRYAPNGVAAFPRAIRLVQ